MWFDRCLNLSYGAVCYAFKCGSNFYKSVDEISKCNLIQMKATEQYRDFPVVLFSFLCLVHCSF